MMRKTASSALCLLLTPLLAAQQIAAAEEPACEGMPSETVFAYRSSINRADLTDEFFTLPGIPTPLYGLSVAPFDWWVELAPVDPAAWANATIGSTLTLRVVHNVFVKGGAEIYAGTLMEAKVIRIRNGRSRTRQGKTEPRVKEVLVANRIKLELEDSPRRHARLNSLPKNLVVWPTKVASMIVLLPAEWVLFVILCSSGCDL